MKMIFASDLDGLIGLNNTLPWRQKADMEFFKMKTSQKYSRDFEPTVVAGRKTAATLLPRGLPGRNIIVLTRNPILHMSESMLLPAEYFESRSLRFDSEEMKHAWVIGGAEIYNLLLPHIDTIYWTKIFTRVTIGPDDVATHFKIPLFEFAQADHSEIFGANKDNEFPYQFLVYKRPPTRT